MLGNSRCTLCSSADKKDIINNVLALVSTKVKPNESLVDSPYISLKISNFLNQSPN